jgi:hypothetical protein
MSHGIEMSADHPQVHPDNTLQSRSDMKSADQENRMFIDTEERSQISATNYFPVSFPDFVSLGCLILRQYPTMSINEATIGSLTLLLMSSILSNMTIPKAQNKPIIAMILSMCAFPLLSIGRNSLVIEFIESTEQFFAYFINSNE